MPGPVTPYFKTNKYVPMNTVVDMDDKQTGRVGANTSSRMPLGVENERGEVVYGFFTANEFNNPQNIFESRMIALQNKPAYKNFAAIGQMYMDLSRRVGYEKNCASWFASCGKNVLSQDKTRLDLTGVESFNANRMSADEKSKFITGLEKTGIDKTFLTAHSNDPAFWSYITELLSTGAHSYQAYRMNRGHLIEKNLNVNKRNNAMYDYAMLLGEKDLICRSSSMTVKSGGKTIEGSFMVNARGTDHYNWDPRRPEMGYKTISLGADALRDISKLQVMDFLCANVDRHPGNMFYELDTSNPDNITIVGIQGIDNDASFGTPSYKGSGVTTTYMSRIKDIKVMDAEMAKSLLSLDETAMDGKIRLAGLGAEEIKAAHERLHALQDRIRSGKIELLSTKAEWEKYTNPEEVQKLRFSEEGVGFNIFDNAFFAVEGYNNKVQKGIFYGAPQPLPAEPAVGKSLTSDQKMNIDLHKNEFDRIRTEIDSYGGLLKNPKEFLPMYNALQECISDLYGMSGALEKQRATLKQGQAPMLSDKERNSLTEKLSDLAKLAGEFAEKNDPPAKSDKTPKKTENLVHIARNIRAYAGFAKESIQRDAMQAEMDLASKMAYDLAKEKGLINDKTVFMDRVPAKSTAPATTKHTYESLRTELSNVDSRFRRSSDQFKDIVKNFKLLSEKPPKNLIDAQVMYNKLRDSAQKYIDYKTPEGVNTKLSDYEKKRVAFAGKLVEYAQAQKFSAKQTFGEKETTAVKAKEEKQPEAKLL